MIVVDLASVYSGPSGRNRSFRLRVWVAVMLVMKKAEGDVVLVVLGQFCVLAQAMLLAIDGRWGILLRMRMQMWMS